MVAAQVHVEPAHNDGHGRVGAHADEEQTRVLHRQVVMHVQQHSKPGDRDGDGADGEQEAVADPVGQHGDHHGKAEGDGPGRDGAQLRLDRVVLVALDDGGREVGVRVGRHDEAEIHEAAEPDLVVGHDAPDVAERDLALGAAVALVGAQPGLDELALVVAEPGLRGGF